MNASGTGTLVATKSLQHYKVKGKYQLFFLNKNQSLFQITNNFFFPLRSMAGKYSIKEQGS